MIATKKELDFRDLPELPGYMGFAEAAKLFGLSKQGMYYRAFDLKQFLVYRVGGNYGERPFYLLVRAEVERVFREERDQGEQQDAVMSLRDRTNAFNRRVKDWGSKHGWARTRINVKGRPHYELVDAYLKAHPEDAKPV